MSCSIQAPRMLTHNSHSSKMVDFFYNLGCLIQASRKHFKPTWRQVKNPYIQNKKLIEVSPNNWIIFCKHFTRGFFLQNRSYNMIPIQKVHFCSDEKSVNVRFAISGIWFQKRKPPYQLSPKEFHSLKLKWGLMIKCQISLDQQMEVKWSYI